MPANLCVSFPSHAAGNEAISDADLGEGAIPSLIFLFEAVSAVEEKRIFPTETPSSLSSPTSCSSRGQRQFLQIFLGRGRMGGGGYYGNSGVT